MRRLWMLGLVAAATGALALTPPPRSATPPQLELRITHWPAAVGVGVPVAVEATIRNQSPTTVRLVDPGDGSESGVRTPIVRWLVFDVGGAAVDVMPRREDPFINGPQRSELFDLRPGETHALPLSIVWPVFERPGSYRVRLQYQNEPALEWHGLAGNLKSMEPAMRRIRATTACDVVSNEFRIDVRLARG